MRFIYLFSQNLNNFFNLMGVLFFLTGTIIIGFTASFADSIYYLSPALTRSTATSLAHIFSPPSSFVPPKIGLFVKIGSVPYFLFKIDP